MRHKRFKLFLVLAGLTGTVDAGTFDCSVIYDEFDSLMHKDFLVSPDNYVPNISGEISFEDFNAIQRGRLYLRKDRPEKGVGVVFTNDKLYGKFLFDWAEYERIIIEDIIIYNRVEDGYAPIHNGYITIKQGEQIDLDTGDVYSAANSNDEASIRADLQLSIGTTTNPVLESINDARVYFPTASLCQ